MNKMYNFNNEWKFHEGVPAKVDFGRKVGDPKLKTKWLKVTDLAESLAGYPDDGWKNVNLPHDFVIERSNFSSDNAFTNGSLGGGIGYYRKEFLLPENTVGNRVFLEVDGVYRNSEVWCNGAYMGRTMSGFKSQSYEITNALDYDLNAPNAVLITCDASEQEGWWYTGGGVYRDVRLLIVPKICFEYNNTFIKTTDIDLQKKSAKFNLTTKINNIEYDSFDAEIQLTVVDGEKRVLSKKENIDINNADLTEYATHFEIDNAIFWSDKQPHLYCAELKITTQFGTQTQLIKFAPRKIEYNAKDGMFLNGEKIFLYGVCGHDDFAGVGVAMNRSVIEYRIDILKSIGVNAYRCSHNPPSSLFLDICDEKGILVLDETRSPAIGDAFMEDFKSLIMRDRNHPCVFCYSTWNEESIIHGKDIGIRIFNKMQNLGKRLDDTRDYLMAINTNYAEHITYHENNGLKLPLNGVNYLVLRDFGLVKQLHEQHPEMCFLNTEASSDCTIRGYNLFEGEPDNVSAERIRVTVWAERKNRRDKFGASCYSDCYPTWGFNLEEAFKTYDKQPHFLGTFIWTGFDYRGEINPYLYPNVISLYGIIDYAGFVKDWAYYLKVLREDEPQIYFMPSTWNLPEKEGRAIDVYLFSNCDEMELFVNGKSLGKQKKEKLDKFYYEVPYEKGKLLAVGYKNGEIVTQKELVTATNEKKLVVNTNKTSLVANGEDCSFISVSVVDENGNEVTNSSIDVKFEITGNAKIIGTGNGNPMSHENDKLPQRKLFWGKALAIVQSGFTDEKVTFTAKANGIESATLTLTINKCDNTDKMFSTDKEAKELEDTVMAII